MSAFSPQLLKIMDNMQALHECKDNRDGHYNRRRNLLRGSRNTRMSEDVINASGGIEADDDNEAFEDIIDRERVYSEKKAYDDSEILATMSGAESGGLFQAAPKGVAIQSSRPNLLQLCRNSYNMHVSISYNILQSCITGSSTHCKTKCAQSTQM